MRGAQDEVARALAEVDAIRRRVVNVVGHTLRTPVTTIRGLTDALAHETDPGKRDELVEAVRRNAQLLEHLLDDLLVATGVSTVLPVADPEPQSTHTATRSAWDSLHLAGTLEFEGDDADVVARPDGLVRILALLLENAARYGTGTVIVRVTRAVDPPGRVSVEIANGGPGPSDEELRRAFELFYRGEHAVMTAPGFGIGLSVARALAHHEDGDVNLERRGEVIVATLELGGT